MCQFCVQHGEGKRWYLEASNYSADLESDLERRAYVVHFIDGFEEMRAKAITAGEVLRKLPAPISRVAKRTISHNMQKDHFGQPLPIEDVEQVLDLATSITVIPCICRMHERNKTAEEVCVLVTTQPVESVLMEGFRDYQDGPELDDFRKVSKAEALELMRGCEERGLMHSIWTFKTPFTAAICNCNLESGCMAMKLTAGYDIKLMWRGETVARMDADKCTRCGACAKVCPFSAISANGSVTFHAEKCWGCGICRSSCSHDAIRLAERASIPEVANVW